MRMVASAAVSLAIAMSAASCAYGPVGADGPAPECYATTSGPSGDGSGISTRKAAGMLTLVVGTVWVHCDPSPSEHVLDVSLWAQPPNAIDDWHEVADRGDIARIPNALPYPNVVTAQCLPLEFQVRYSVVGTSSQGEPFTASGKGYPKTLTARDCGLG